MYVRKGRKWRKISEREGEGCKTCLMSSSQVIEYICEGDEYEGEEESRGNKIDIVLCPLIHSIILFRPVLLNEISKRL